MKKIQEKKGVDRFGQLMRKRRRELEMTVEELSHASDVSVSTINRIEHNKQPPSLIAIFRVCDVLGVQPGDFIEPAWQSWKEHGE